MKKNPPTVEQPLRRSSRLVSRRSSTELSLETQPKAPVTRRLSLDSENLPNNAKPIGKLQPLDSPCKRVTRRSSLTLNGDDDKKVLNGDKNANTPEKHLDSIQESADETNQNESPRKTKSTKRKSPQLNLSVISEEKNSPIVILQNQDAQEDVNHENVAMEIDTTISEIIVEKTPTKNPYVSLNNTSSISPKTKNNNNIPSCEKVKTQTTSTPIHKDVMKILFTEDDETSEDSKRLNKKLDNLMQGVLAESSDEEEEEDEVTEKNPFIDDEAEEGEEDTSSEGSNDINDFGESIHSEDSSFSDDEFYEADSFIDPDEDAHTSLLPGDEYDLSIEELKKQAESFNKSRSRIIGLSSSGSDDNEIVIIDRPKKKEKKRRNKSRIIRPKDDSSSDEEEALSSNQTKTLEQNGNENGIVSVVKIEGLEEEQSPKKCSSIIILENIRIDNLSNEGLSEHIQQVVKDVRSDIPDKGEVSLNVTLDYFENGKAEALTNGEHNTSSTEKNKEESNNVVQAEKNEKKQKKQPSPVKNKEESSTAVEDLQVSAEKPQKKKKKKKGKKARNRIRCAKRKLECSEIHSPEKKQKKNNDLALNIKENDGIVDMAVKNTIQVIKPDAHIGAFSNDWLVNTLEKKTKPSKKSKLKNLVVKNLEKKVEFVKSTKNAATTGMKFHVKDFKNRVLYEERNGRVDTKQVLNKKGVYSF